MVLRPRVVLTRCLGWEFGTSLCDQRLEIATHLRCQRELWVAWAAIFKNYLPRAEDPLPGQNASLYGAVGCG